MITLSHRFATVIKHLNSLKCQEIASCSNGILKHSCQDYRCRETLLHSDAVSYCRWKQTSTYILLGRVYTVHPNNVECFYLRLLLHEIWGPTCFNYLKKVSGIVHPMYQSACRALGLLEDDMQWDLTLQEASISDSPHKLSLIHI